jgi:hypothetical protein
MLTINTATTTHHNAFTKDGAPVIRVSKMSTHGGVGVPPIQVEDFDDMCTAATYSIAYSLMGHKESSEMEPLLSDSSSRDDLRKESGSTLSLSEYSRQSSMDAGIRGSGLSPRSSTDATNGHTSLSSDNSGPYLFRCVSH